ncbi:hypothetical protein [Planctomycetes bacterium Poly30]|uniref:hypothetical protein n=1 Tax=Saltatorellus ferox TaxID=2528018 RepID=UPI0011A13A95
MRVTLALLSLAAFILSVVLAPEHGLIRDSLQNGQSTYRLPAWKWPYMDGAGVGYTDLSPERTDLVLEGVVRRPSADSETWRILYRGDVEVSLDEQELLVAEGAAPGSTVQVRATWSGEFARLRVVMHPTRNELMSEPRHGFAIQSENAFGGWTLLGEDRLFADVPTPGVASTVARWTFVRTLSLWLLLGVALYSLVTTFRSAWRTTPSAVKLAVAVFTAAFLTRAIVLTDRFAVDPRLWTLSSNGDNYVLFARATLSGGPSAVHGAYYGPGNVWWLMAVTSAIGPELAKLSWVNVLLGSVSVSALAYAAARARGLRAGAFVGLFASFYGPLVFFQTSLQVAAVATSAMALLIAAVLRHHHEPTPGRAFTSGLFLGAAALARPTHLALAPVLFFVFVLGRRWRDAALLTVGTLCVVLPQTALNQTSLDHSLISANGPINLLLGNNTDASGDYSRTPAFFAARDKARENGETLVQATKDEILEDPVRAAELFVRKCALLFLQDETDGMISFPVQGLEASPFLRAITWNGRIGMAVLAWLAFFGAAAALMRDRLPADRLAITAVICTAAFGLATAAVFVNARIRSPEIPLLILLAALGLDRLSSRQLRLRSAIFAATLATALTMGVTLVLTHLPRKPVLGALPSDAVALEAAPGAGLQLIGYRIEPEELIAGRHAYVTLFWRAAGESRDDAKVRVSILGMNEGKPLSSVKEDIGTVQFPPRPPSTWSPGAIVQEAYYVPLRRTCPDAVRIQATYGSGESRDLGGPHRVAPPRPLQGRILD